jgi:hypothetical protein
MLDKRKISRNSETDRYIQLANDLIVLAEKELSAFIRAVQKLFGAEQARQFGAALDRGTGTYGLAVWRLHSRLAPGDGGRKRPASAVGSGNSDRGRQRLGA